MTIIAHLLATVALILTGTQAVAAEAEPTREPATECIWNGVRWQTPCVYDHRHTSDGTRSFKMFVNRHGTVTVKYISHRRAHRLLGY